MVAHSCSLSLLLNDGQKSGMKHICTEPGTEGAEAGELPWLEVDSGHTEGCLQSNFLG